MANHSLGGLRSLETIDAGDRVLSRLSPVQLWIVRETLEREFLTLPPSCNVRQAAKRLTMRGILHMTGDTVRYRPLAHAEVVAPGYQGVHGDLHHTGRSRARYVPD